MILHNLHLRDWRNIAALDLEGLDAPMVVLHGPNRTGKSSVVLALRYCLFDFDHNSRAAALVNCVPWRSKKSPEVCVEFSQDGRRYRVRKIFSPAKDGEARLEEITATGAAVLERGKEADRQVRKLLGLEKSTEGLNELLWLTQGEVRLPAADKLSRPLQQRLESVLGTLLTSHDWKFQEVLDRCWSEFFTPTGRIQKNSPVAVLEDDIAKRQSEVERLTTESRQGEALLREHESLEEQNRQERINVGESEREVEQLRSAARDVAARRAAHEQAQAALASAEKERDAVRARLDEFAKVRADLIEKEREAVALTGALQAAAQTQQRATDESLAAKRQLDALRRERDGWERQRVELDELDRLVNLAAQAERLRKLTDEATALEKRLRERDAELARVVAPDDATVTTLRESARQIHRLEARLEAAAVHVEIEPHDPQSDGRFQVRCDDAEPSTGRTATFRQRMEMLIDGWGAVRVTRGEQDRSVDDVARQLDKLRRDFGDAVRGFGIDPATPTALDELVRLQTQREVLLREKHTDERRLRELAPDGTAALSNRAEQLARQRAGVVERFPELAEWNADPADLERRKSEFQAAGRALQERLTAAEAERDRRFAAKDAAEEESARLREQAARLDMNRELTAKRLTELGDEHSLSQAAQRAEANCCEAGERVRQTALSADEERIEQQLTGAEAALVRRRERLAEREKQAERIRGQLLQMHGLHDRLAHAEAELHRMLAEQRRCRIEADAHQLLRDLFEECRERQVRATTGRIESQVVEWAGRLGLSEYQSVEFRGGYLPDGLRLPAVAESVAIEDESYGTLEQFALLVRLAVGQLVAAGQRHVAILDDPLTHADLAKHRRMLEILEDVASGRARSDDGTPLAPLQMLIFTCHPERFDHLADAKQIDLATAIQRDF